ncbi:FAD binding domain-containing protein [Elusimicrobiota bacterium]
MEYIIPDSVEDIYDKLGRRKAYYLAGGTDIMVMRKNGEIIKDRPWVDISGLSELNGITLEKDALLIGSLCLIDKLSDDKRVLKNAKAVYDAAILMGSPLIRNLATIGGNFANSNPAADIIPAVNALNGSMILQRGTRIREVSADDFCFCPGENLLEEAEIITHIKIPVIEDSNSGFMKIGPRKALAISKVSLAVWWKKTASTIEDIRIAAGAVGPKCLRAPTAENFLKGSKLTHEIMDEACGMLELDMSPIDDFRSTQDYRMKMTGVLLKKILSGR